jgi:nucleotidyltransferase/DNA polymerase involved in DNA repair
LRKIIHVDMNPFYAPVEQHNKFLAKLASDHRKPNGQYVISPEMDPAFVEALPVGKFHGIALRPARR